MNIFFTHDTPCWVDFTDERLPAFSHNYDCLFHGTSDCSQPPNTLCVEEGKPYGTWMKYIVEMSPFFGSRQGKGSGRSFSDFLPPLSPVGHPDTVTQPVVHGEDLIQLLPAVAGASMVT
ncbi:hypothetical protein L3X38_011686 [Prunus dulcis]|uniref:Uncharacterized protein n=1 Tax=Prunus dulcis TaxID=3755 RepID=A0AAD4ZFA5_PRUDU|nr:hypothetical protein L3X38_011686 [Prunus dulcis]